ncbi:polysaccharide pyruvyl transferase family protein [Pelagibacterium sp. 26DY04]|uniref:polysaccharide pyruvyl transferase family protein n=1 Tax=Pelagibacterium sp. 26DY04 TaxID=2967130 RepID=UPI002815F9AA|nr:polysaccharide pyruvyl transferase family protein [Pelagibacterium sp. 26DY04]WMT87658.1 polysaccharide pyruvyl transferase family protein [Pelagibacterium sp. 26DY04]
MPIAPRIAVLTFHRCINYGSYWQARCLVEGLRERGHGAVLLDHHSERVKRAEWRSALQPLLPKRSEKADLPLYAGKTRRFLDAIDSLPLSKPFALDRPWEMDPHELVLVGSDEVWNLRHPWYGGHPVFFGEGVRAGQIASYAASFGNQDAGEGLDGRWAGKLRDFSRISIRDQNSRRLVEDALGCEPELVLDPCLQFSHLIEGKALRRLPPYLAVYGHGFPQWFIDNVRVFAQDKGLRLISIGYRNDWADEQWIDAGPEEFAGFMAGAQAVVTTFFHGCVFALVNQKPFACALTDYRSNKIRDLTETVGAQRHLVGQETPSSHYWDILGEAPERTIPHRIAILKRRSDAYLDAVCN